MILVHPLTAHTLPEKGEENSRKKEVPLFVHGSMSEEKLVPLSEQKRAHETEVPVV